MTKIAISPNVNGTGTFTLAAPDSNTDRTLTLPDAGGEVLTNTSDIEAQVKTATSATGSAPIFACRAWVNFNGTGTVSIRASGNVSSITDLGTGAYRVNFATGMGDSNYCTALTSGSPQCLVFSQISSSVEVRTRSSGGANQNEFRVMVAIFR